MRTTRGAYRWDCLRQGCDRDANHPAWELLHGALPRNITPTDIDGMVECANHFLFLEFKRGGADPKNQEGQRQSLLRLTRASPAIRVLYLWGDAARMILTHRQMIFRGQEFAKVSTDLEDLRRFMAKWAEGAERAPAPVSPA